MHARKQIRDAVCTLLSGLQTTQANVFPSRVYSLDENQLPSLSVYTVDAGNDELVTRVTLGRPSKFHRVCPLIIEGHALVAEDVDDVLDQISLEIEVAMSDVLTVTGKVVTAQLVSTGKDLIGDNESQIGIVRLLYTVPYVTSESTPDILE